MDGSLGFCRDCLQPQANTLTRCEACGSPRVVRHPELAQLSLAHVDCDAFYASVEKRDDPSLANKPVIVGGGTRGVVTTCCYIARIKGVRSAMPMFKALKLCPEATIVRPRMKVYAEVGLQVREMMRSLTPVVEPLSIDEAFLDLSGTEKLHGAIPALTLARFSRRVSDEVGISISVGLAANKFLAKVASDLEKPRGFSVIGAAEAYDFLATKPVSLIWGVGRAMQNKLHGDNIRLISDLQQMEEEDLIRRYGSMGMRLARLSKGLDFRRVEARSASKSVSSETTFNDDKSLPADLVPILRRQSEKVAARLKEKHLAGQTVVLKLKTADFKSRTRNTTLPDPTQLADRIFSVGRTMLQKELDGTRFRLLGIGVSDMKSDETADPGDLVDDGAQRRAKAERAMDDLRARFGDQSVELGLTFGTVKPRSEPQLDK
ncbi:DNA polymerase IV [Ahrensia sp. R2A130]|uniref:DNA polymerase IV n=1 Tax=Ahrensia sp. R2A130 TaxID=744979 RepID=UPI0005917C40|nr:DNA polymerase IV [Ahrensia sp. R2A130]